MNDGGRNGASCVGIKVRTDTTKYPIWTAHFARILFAIHNLRSCLLHPNHFDGAIKSKHDQLDGCIVWNAHNTVLGEEARLIGLYIVPVCYVKHVGMENLVMSLLVYTGKKFQL